MFVHLMSSVVLFFVLIQVLISKDKHSLCSWPFLFPGMNLIGGGGGVQFIQIIRNLEFMLLFHQAPLLNKFGKSPYDSICLFISQYLCTCASLSF